MNREAAPRPTVSVIVAVARDNAIGRNGDLLYRLRPDMRHFKEITMGHTVIMGRKTWDSLPKGALPGRRNMVITRNAAFTAPGAEVFTSPESALAAAAGDGEVFVIGGAHVYRQMFPLADRIYLTEIDAPADGADTFFPEISAENWQTVRESDTQIDPETGLRYRFAWLSRK